MLKRIFLGVLVIALNLRITPFIMGHASGGIQIRPPFYGTYRMISFFDHFYPNYSDFDTEVTIYNGDISPNEDPYFYRGHSGYDWALTENTAVLAVADGTVRFVQRRDIGGYGIYVQIQHENEYISLYAHLNEVLVNDEAIVKSGDVIGYSGDTGHSTGPHLHFGIYFGPNANEAYATDPFGWKGNESDPLLNYPYPGQGHKAACLWRGLSSDSISCDDIIIEDKGVGFSIFGTWLQSQNGSGSHIYSRFNTTSNEINFAVWEPGYITPGRYQIFIYAPLFNGSPNATSEAKFTLYTRNNIFVIFQDLRNIPDLWVTLGIFDLSGNNDDFIVLESFTNETPGSTIVFADAIKFRTRLLRIPLVHTSAVK